MNPSLRQRLSQMAGYLPPEAVRGAGWVAAGKAASQAARFVRVIILARLLSPGDFGQMGVAMMTLGCLEVFTEPGLNMALIQRKGDIRFYLDSVFTIGVVRGLAVGLLVLLAAPVCGEFFHVTEAVRVIQAVGLVAVLRALTNPSTVHLTRNLNFKKLFYWNMSEAVTALVTAVALGLLYRNVWALALSSIAGQAVKTAVSYRIDGYRPKLNFEWQKARPLLRFGRWAWGTNALTFASLQGDNAVVGRVLGAGALGLYQVAFSIASLPRTAFTEIVAQVAYPLFCKHQQNQRELRRLYRRLSGVVWAVNGACCVAALALAEVIILLVLGPRWLPIAPALRILSAANLLRSAAVLPAYLFYAVGQPRVTFELTVVRVLTMALTIYPLAAWYGLNGVAVSVLLSTAAMAPLWMRSVAPALRYEGPEQIWGHRPLARRDEEVAIHD